MNYDLEGCEKQRALSQSGINSECSWKDCGKQV